MKRICSLKTLQKYKRIINNNILICLSNNKIYALDRFCHHNRLPLDKGIIDNNQKKITCPWHGRKISLIDGKVDKHAEEKQKIFNVYIYEKYVYLDD